MCKNMKEFMSDLNAPMLLTRRGFLFGMTLTALSALMLGFLLAPPRSLSLCSGNNITANTGNEDGQPAEEKAAVPEENA